MTKTKSTLRAGIALATLLASLSIGIAPAAADSQPSAAMLRYPDVSAESICFVFANDIWIVPKTGGEASPLASPRA